MAQKHIDTTGNEHNDLVRAKIEANFTDLYSSFGGATDPSVTTVTASGLGTFGSLKVGTGTKTVTAAAGAATLNKPSGIVTTESLTTAAGATYTLTLTNSTVAAGDIALVSLDSNGSAGLPEVVSAKCTLNTLTVIVQNDGSASLNAAVKIGFLILKA